MTHAKVAATLDLGQRELSEIEQQTDNYLSTFADCLEALGGQLEIRAVFPDRNIRITQFEDLQ